MKVLMVITTGDFGGAQRHVLDISRELVRRGHEIQIAVGEKSEELTKAAGQGSQKIKTFVLKNLVRSICLKTDLLGLFELYRIIKKEKPDIVHCHTSKAGILGSLAGWLAGSKVIYTAHGFVFREDLSFATKYFYIFIEKFTSFFRHKIITVSQSDADAAREKRIARKKKLAVIPNGIDASLSESLLEPVAARSLLGSWCNTTFQDEKIIVSIANFYPAKNLLALVQAFEFVLPRIPEARLVFIGDGEQRQRCEDFVSQNPKLQKTVFFAGKQTDAYQILRGADILCLSSTKEGMPYVVLEAKLAGTPVVATRVGGVAEMGEGVNLRLVVPHSSEMLSDAIVEVLRDNKKVSSPLSESFTLRGMVDAIEGVYESVR